MTKADNHHHFKIYNFFFLPFNYFQLTVWRHEDAIGTVNLISSQIVYGKENKASQNSSSILPIEDLVD